MKYENCVICVRHGPFRYLQFDKRREEFLEVLTSVTEAMQMTVITAVIRKGRPEVRCSG